MLLFAETVRAHQAVAVVQPNLGVAPLLSAIVPSELDQVPTSVAQLGPAVQAPDQVGPMTMELPVAVLRQYQTVATWMPLTCVCASVQLVVHPLPQHEETVKLTSFQAMTNAAAPAVPGESVGPHVVPLVQEALPLPEATLENIA